LAAEWAKSGVRVNALAPGYVATDMIQKMRERPELFNVWLDMTPMGRLGEPSEIAAAVLYLASAASSYFYGRNSVDRRRLRRLVRLNYRNDAASGTR
jgi:NAD(P)-dependent dehydrogenase (short-subunit alcohol dehydrogenase family)